MVTESPAAPATDDKAVLDVFLGLVAEKGLAALSLAEIARRLPLPLAELHRRFPDPTALLAAFAAQLDQAVLAGGPPSADETPRDRLFEVSMRRFDALQPYKAAVRRLLRSGDPWLALTSACRLRQSAALMLETAGISSWGGRGRLRSRALAALHLALLPIWLSDDSADLARTMAALDKALRRMERLSILLFGEETPKKPTMDGTCRETSSEGNIS